MEFSSDGFPEGNDLRPMRTRHAKFGVFAQKFRDCQFAVRGPYTDTPDSPRDG